MIGLVQFSPSDIRGLARSPAWRLRVTLVLLVVLALALGVAIRATTGGQTLDRLVGRAAPAFSLPAEAHGQAQPGPVTLAAQRGHPTLLVFFYTLCAHCLGELQTVRGVVAAHAASGLVPLYIDSPAELTAIPDAYLARIGLDAPALLDRDGAVAATYGIRYYPALALLDARGIVRATWTGETSATVLDDGLSRLTG